MSARRLRLTVVGVAAHTVSPRFARIYPSRNYPWLIRQVAAFQTWRATAFAPEAGAEDVLYPLLAPEREGQPGKYFCEGHEAQSAPESYNLEGTRRLWKSSEELVELKFC
jgi:hypothetical protein